VKGRQTSSLRVYTFPASRDESIQAVMRKWRGTRYKWFYRDIT